MTEEFLENNERIWTRVRLCVIVKSTPETSYHIPDNIHSKCDVTLRLYFTYPEDTQEGVEVNLHSFSTSALDEGERSTSRFNRFNPAKESRYPLKWRKNGSPELVWTCFEIRKTPPAEIRTLVLVPHREAARPTTRHFRRLCAGCIHCLWWRWCFKMQ